VQKDAGGDPLVLDSSDELHPPRASRAFEHVDAKGALHPHGPREAPLAARDVEAGGITTKRRNSLVGGFNSEGSNVDLYNDSRPHQALGYMSPRQFRAQKLQLVA
jgi:hypothetical protein